MISRDIEFDKQSIINILQALDGTERVKYLKTHRNEIAKALTFNDENEMAEFIFNLAYVAYATPAGIYDAEDHRAKIANKCNVLIAAEMIKLLQPQLAVFENFAACYSLLGRLTKPLWPCKHDFLYPFRLAFAEVMRSAIHNPQEMGQVAKLLHEKDAAIFIKAQHKYWEKHKKKNTPVLFAPAPEPSAPPAEYFEPPKQKG